MVKMRIEKATLKYSLASGTMVRTSPAHHHFVQANREPRTLSRDSHAPPERKVLTWRNATGDFVRFNPQTGGLIMLGRSDGILKPAGVRFGSSEIYNVILEYFSDIEDGLCIGRRREQDTDETVVLFLKMAPGAELSEELKEQIRSVIRKDLSARHVPGIIDECWDIPVTINGKK